LITFHLETWQSYYFDPDRERLWREHYEEFVPAHEDKMPMGPDLAVYEAAERLGQLICVVARERGMMIGYCIVFVRRHIHYSSICAFEDSYYLSKTKRLGLAGGKIGIGLVETALREAKRRAAVRAYFMTKEFLSIARLLGHLGFTQIDTVHAIWL
jgi:hypothetical protein